MKKILATLVLCSLFSLTACAEFVATVEQEVAEALNNIKNEAANVTDSVNEKVDRVNEAVDSVNTAVDSVNQAVEDVKAVAGGEEEDRSSN